MGRNNRILIPAHFLKKLIREMWFINILIIFAIAFIVDPSVYLPYHTPKNYALIILVSLALVVYFIYKNIRKKKFYLSISGIEILLSVRLVWLVITNPALLTHQSNLGFWILLSLTFLTFLTRQIASSNTYHPGESLSSAITKDERIINYFFRATWIIGLLQALLGFYQLYSFRGFSTQFMKTPMIGTIGSANGYGLFLSISIIAVIADVKNRKTLIVKIFLFFIALLMFAALLINGSRGALSGLVFSVIIVSSFIFFVKKEERDIKNKNNVHFLKWFKRGRLVIFPAILVCLSIFVFGLYKMNPESSSGRFMVWTISSPMVSDHPLLGVGHGRFAVEYLNYQTHYFENPENSDIAYKAANLKQAHNEYLQAFCESGIIGGILFLSIWLFALWKLFQQLRKNITAFKTLYYGLSAILLAILFHALVDTPLHVLPISVLAYTALGLVPVNSYMIKIKSKMIRWGIFLLFLAYSIFTLYEGIHQYHGYIEWEKGVEYTSNHRWKWAIDKYQKALERLPDKGELQFHLGSAMVMSGSYSRGIYFLEESLQNFNDRNIYLSLSFANLKIENFDEAENYAKVALSMFPDHLAPHLLLGEIYYKQGKNSESRESLQKCINRQTHIQSEDVVQIMDDARKLWDNHME